MATGARDQSSLTGLGLSHASVSNLLGREGETKTSRLKELKVLLNPNLWEILTSSHGLQSGPRSQPRAGTSVPTAPDPNKLHRTIGFGKFLFSFPTHFRGWGVFQDSDTFVNKERKKTGGAGSLWAEK